MRYFRVYGLILFILIPFISTKSQDIQEDIKYIVFMRAPEREFNQHHPYTINIAGFKEIIKHFDSLPQSQVKPGIGFIFSYLKSNINTVKLDLQRFLAMSKVTNTPVLVKFDGEQWWQNRPDLWNWWDPRLPGYNPDNFKNVEWSGWEPEYALKIAWRNWGRQIRVLPPPNLMSPAYRQACHKAMDELMPVVMNWYKSLPEDKKYLFIGLNVGWESSIGINSYYYPNGNDLLDEPEVDDPKKTHVLEDVLSRGYVQIGYAAVKTVGLRSKGDITEDDLFEVVRRHLEDVSKYAYDFGFPRDKIFSHGVGNRNGEKLYDAAVNDYSCPGWSEYWYADDPSKDKGIVRNLKRSDAPYWAAVEWLLPGPHEKDRWKDAFEKNLYYPKCKFLCVYNWEGIRNSNEVIDAAREVVLEHQFN